MAASDYGYISHKKKVGFIFGLIGTTLGMIVLIVGFYVVHVLTSYYRIGDKEIKIDAGQSALQEVNLGDTLTAVTYNIGFGAYSQNYTFFMDTGFDKDGNPTCGSKSTAQSYDEVMFNVQGAYKTLTDLNPDFIMLQEVDTYSTRSYRVNQDKMAQESFKQYDHTFANNFHAPFLPYPLTDMHGLVNSGLSTFSKYKMTEREAYRVQYTVSDGLSRLFDLDRCYTYQSVSVSNGKKLYIINSHMSAYDDGARVRAKQVQELREAFKLIKETGDYLIVGGDFNHDLLSYNPVYMEDASTFKYTKDNKPFNEKKKNPEWISYLFNEDGKSPLLEPIINSRDEEITFHAYSGDNIPTCRNNDIAWENGKTYVCAVDGFICSDNVQALGIQTIATNGGNLGKDYFAFSDHQPVQLTFRLA